MMEPAILSLAEELAEVTRWSDAAPPRFEDDEMHLLAFELWQLASCPETPAAEAPEVEEPALYEAVGA